jgi:hypothetical protein
MYLDIYNETLTQYASSNQNPDVQSDETAGFQARNWAVVMPNSAATISLVSPAVYISLFLHEGI